MNKKQPRIKKASPHDVKKAFGEHAARVLEVIDSHADSLEGLIAQVQKLTTAVYVLQTERDMEPAPKPVPRIILPS